jgi:uncharacterized membrane protein
MKLVLATIFIIGASILAVLGKTVAETLCVPVVFLLLAFIALLMDCYKHPRRWMP